MVLIFKNLTIFLQHIVKHFFDLSIGGALLQSCALGFRKTNMKTLSL